MEYSRSFREEMVRKMLGPSGETATELARKAGVCQPTLSRWKREALQVAAMKIEPRAEAERKPKSPQEWTAAEKMRLLSAAEGLGEAELGALLRREGVHQAQMNEWYEAARSALGGGKRTQEKVGARAAKRIRELEKELARKEKALAEVSALLVLKKKAQAIWGDEDDTTDPKNEP
jgi:transposase